MKKFFFLLAIFFFSCLALPVSADDYAEAIYYVNQSDNHLCSGYQCSQDVAGYTWGGSLKYFSQNYSNISKMRFYDFATPGEATGIYWINICKTSDLDNVYFTNSNDCEFPDDNIGQATSSPVTDEFDDTYLTFDLNRGLIPAVFTGGTEYYYKIKCVSSCYAGRWIYDNTTLLGEGSFFYSIIPENANINYTQFWDLKTYYDTEIATQSPPSIVYNYNPAELPNWIGDDDIKIADKLLCYTNNACLFPITYASSSVNDIIFLTQEYDLPDLIFDLNIDGTTTHAIASTTLPLNPFINRIGIALPIQTTATTTNICAYGYDDVQYEDYSVCRTEVKWVATSSLGVVCNYDIESACDNMASSTGGLLQDTLYGFGCGMRQAIYWAVTPHCEAVTKLNDTYNRLQNSFPYSIFIQLKTIYTNTHATTTAFEFPILFAWSGATTTAFTQNSMYTVFGDAWDKLYKVMEYFIYTMFVVWFSLRIFNNQKDDS